MPRLTAMRRHRSLVSFMIAWHRRAGASSLNDGDDYTTNNIVSIRYSAEGADYVMYSDDPTFSGETYKAYLGTTTTTYNFPSSDGVKTLYIKFKDAAGNETETMSDSIILDTTGADRAKSQHFRRDV